jgi:TPR repeat protein
MQALGLQRPDEALRLLDRACSLGHAVGCSNLAGVLRGGVGGGPKDPAQALGLYDRACRLGFAEACATAGSMLAEGTRRAVERARPGLSTRCAATVLLGEPAGARKALAERRSAAASPPMHPLAQAR